MISRIPFGDLAREVGEVRMEIDAALARVLTRGSFVLGPELKGFEDEFGRWLGSVRVVGVSSGTDAIAVALLALGIGPGAEVVTVANTCAPTAFGIAMTGARIRLVDCDPETLMMSVAELDAAMTSRIRAIVPVHLYGSAADIRAIRAVAMPHDAMVIEDCAQAIGTELYEGVQAGTLGHAAAFSFYPTKNLGAYGDSGAVTSNDAAIADRAAALRHHGQWQRDIATEFGLNARLDELQAAVLRAKLPHVRGWNDRRRAIANFYEERFQAVGVRLPARPEYVREHSYHLFPILVPERERFRARLAARAVETLVHYPVPLHLQPALSDLGYTRGRFPNSERACDELVSIPLYPQLTDAEVERVAASVLAALS